MKSEHNLLLILTAAALLVLLQGILAISVHTALAEHSREITGLKAAHR